jgi:hypothetical protein
MALIVCLWSGLNPLKITHLTQESILFIKQVSPLRLSTSLILSCPSLLSQSLWLSFIRLNIVYLWSSWFFHNMSLGTGHHHPLIWHDGDKIPKTIDWGIFQVIAVVRCDEIDQNLLLASTTFGNHILHHLLPSVDHSKLPLVSEVFIQTCREFQINFQDSWFEKRKIKPFQGWFAMVQQVCYECVALGYFPPLCCVLPDRLPPSLPLSVALSGGNC